MACELQAETPAVLSAAEGSGSHSLELPSLLQGFQFPVRINRADDISHSSLCPHRQYT